MGAAKKCDADGCRHRAHVMFKGIPNAKRQEFEHHGRLVVVPHDDSWFYFQCDTCLCDFCRDCATENEDGTIECYDCLQDRLRREAFAETKA